MREFFDKDTGITWVTPVLSKIELCTPRFIDSDQKEIDEFTKELNSDNCKSPEIDNFITGGMVPLGSFFEWALDKYSRPFYAFDDGKLVGSAIINGREYLDTVAMEHYMDYVEKNKNKYPNGMDGFLPLDKARRIFNISTIDNNTDINYLVVIPKAQGRGVGTRMLSSIKNNPSFFSHSLYTQTTSAIVHKNNIASKTIFYRNGFKEYTLDRLNQTSNFHDFLTETPATDTCNM